MVKKILVGIRDAILSMCNAYQVPFGITDETNVSHKALDEYPQVDFHRVNGDHTHLPPTKNRR